MKKGKKITATLMIRLSRIIEVAVVVEEVVEGVEMAAMYGDGVAGGEGEVEVEVEAEEVEVEVVVVGDGEEEEGVVVGGNGGVEANQDMVKGRDGGEAYPIILWDNLHNAWQKLHARE